MNTFSVQEGRKRDQAFVMPLVIPAALLLLLGASTLLSRTVRNYLATTKQTDAQLARDAAESGMNRVLSILNPVAKHSSDPYVSFLLASRWVPNSGTTYTTGETSPTEVVRSGWRLTTLSRTDVRNLLTRCGLADRGQHPNQLPPANEDGYRNILSGAIGPKGDVGNIQLRYLVTNYVPPERVASPLTWPTECADFSSLSGGSGQISVEGRVIRNGNVLATYTLTRSIDIQGWPLPMLPASWLDNSALPALPGPPVGLRIAGVASSLGQLYMRYYKDISTDLSFCTLGFCEQKVALPQCLNNCLPNGQPFIDGNTMTSVPLETRVLPVSDVIPGNDSDLPRYPFNTNLPPAGLVPNQINESRANYPFDLNGVLYPECRDSNLADANRPREFRPNEIDCWIESISVPARVSSLSYQATGGPSNSPLITLSLASGQRFDVQRGSSILLSNVSGWPVPLPAGNQIKGVVTSSSVSTISITPVANTPLPPSNRTVAQINNTNPCSRNAPSASNPSPPACVFPAAAVELRVNTQARPVNLIIRGNVGTTEVGNFVSIKHRVQGDLNYSHAHTRLDTRPLWNRLRIFGRAGSSAACATNISQTFNILPNPGALPGDASLGGAFLWLPRGNLVYGTPVAPLDTYPRELLTVWWICNLNISGLRSLMDFITPLYGNQDAVSAFLPGGFLTSSGVFTPDERFTVYPSLMRIRSAY
ncbi:MAG: hypothetical protein VKP63_00140 [Cyanobacteriota bacterium]|nr:hypothetical protein [Cyanobacteriota bacterium]